MASIDRDISIPSVDDDASELYIERNEHFTGEVSFFTTLTFDGEDATIRISEASARTLREWLSQQLAK